MDCAKEKSIDFVRDPLTATVVSDLRTLLSAIKGRTILMKNSITPTNPLQSHFDEILNCIDESADITTLLLDSHPH